MRPGRAGSPPPAPTPLQSFAALLRVLVVGMFLLTFVFQTYRIPSGSMIPTLEIGDCVLVSKTSLGGESGGSGVLSRLLPRDAVRRGDLLVFLYPLDPGRLLFKRGIGLPCDLVPLRDGRVFLNGSALREPYVQYTPGRPDVFRDEFPNLRETDPNIDPAWWLALRRTLREDGELPIPAGAFFVLGDNRNHSEDSRYWGFVPENAAVGRPVLVYFAVPNGAEAPAGGPLARLAWIAGWVEQRVGVLR